MSNCNDRDWLANYLADEMTTHANVAPDKAVPLAQRMSAAITAAFNTITKVEALTIPDEDPNDPLAGIWPTDDLT